MTTLVMKKFTPHYYEKYRVLVGDIVLQEFATYRDVLKFIRTNKYRFRIRAISLIKLNPEFENSNREDIVMNTELHIDPIGVALVCLVIGLVVALSIEIYSSNKLELMKLELSTKCNQQIQGK